ncbi:MAG: hypothetical protein JWO05_1999 [Gemmatimonadetes bacterium]|nr:hypothetical protein [Gemmatimonadota bacterium]
MVFLNLCAGLDRIGVPYRVNDYAALRKSPGTLACVVGKSFLLERFHGPNPILFGAAVFNHPSDDPDLFERLPVKRILVPGPWIRDMFVEAYGPERVHAWPVGIDTERWKPTASTKDVDVLLYDKIRWDRQALVPREVDPVRRRLEAQGLRVERLTYGSYEPGDFSALLARARSMVFICEHETQGLAYQQALSAGVPILAWNGTGEWVDREYWPHRVRFGPVTAVPYWDDRCGLKYDDVADFSGKLDEFMRRVNQGAYAPREYVLEHLTLERCAQLYCDQVAAVRGERDRMLATAHRLH